MQNQLGHPIHIETLTPADLAPRDGAPPADWLARVSRQGLGGGVRGGALQ